MGIIGGEQMNMVSKFVRFELLAFILVILGSLAIDQGTKHIAEGNLKVWADDSDLKLYKGKRYPLVDFGNWSQVGEDPQFYLRFSFNYVRNQGAAWGFLSDMDDTYRIPFFYLVTILAIGIIGMYIKSTPVHHRLARFALILILSGALGNLTDRILLGYVIDFIDVGWVFPVPFSDFSWRYNFPNFNWADSCITVGVSFLIFDMIFLESKRKMSQEHSAA